MKSSFFTLLLSLFCFSLVGQETTTEDNSLEAQFDKIYRTSTSYQTYKVISKTRYQKLKSDVLDSLKTAKKNIIEKDILIKSKDEELNNLNEKINTTQLNLDASVKKENTIYLFGIELNKSTYNIILWCLIGILLLSLLYFIYKFNNSNALTKEAKNNLIEVEEEFNLHRKKSLEKEQKLRRQLQDEINKQRNS